ncbi:butyrate kinase [Butyrivibrio fibrisolvens DSM 3071]|uniref:Probable butyrate kinase n=1 Tax=Butyrivibrio fibrisolvens DSM 3071 TaxID=1121131 RepID=A0A1M5ZRY7_BUTFI|nr:butyrate kinase [Butyrivibrio fibrisolvens]SHI26869.1 butyrate kinase [Butyrivibrio fibrisolvens DSM 3071]
MAIKSLIINPGSTSTKIGIFEDEELKMDETLRHSTEEIAKYDSIIDQKDFRKNIILDFLKEKNIDVTTFNVIVGRGGLLKPIEGGTYEVTDAVVKDLEIGVQGQHASNLGGILAREIADQIGVKAYIVDPVVVDELSDVARVSGMPDVQRTSIFHPLNQKAVARRYAKSVGKKYEDLRLVVAHLGGGVSVGAHDHGRIVDVYSAFEGDGAMSPERCGGLPTGALIRLCYSGKFSEKEMLKKATGAGGFNAYLGTNDAREVMKKIDAGDEKARLVMDAFIFQVCKDIGAQATVLKGKVDQIIITGGIAYNERITAAMKERIGFIAPVTVYPGEDELLALAQGAIRVMNGEEQAKVY